MRSGKFRPQVNRTLTSNNPNVNLMPFHGITGTFLTNWCTGGTTHTTVPRLRDPLQLKGVIGNRNWNSKISLNYPFAPLQIVGPQVKTPAPGSFSVSFAHGNNRMCSYERYGKLLQARKWSEILNEGASMSWRFKITVSETGIPGTIDWLFRDWIFHSDSSKHSSFKYNLCPNS